MQPIQEHLQGYLHGNLREQLPQVPIEQPNPMADLVKLSFIEHHEFVSSYMRNNKGGGMKNLRCFPHCSPEHRTKGFCGTNVGLKMKISRCFQSSRLALPETLRCYSEFVRIQDVHKPEMVPGNTRFTLNDMEQMQRTPKFRTKSWFRGLICDDASLVSTNPTDWADVLQDRPSDGTAADHDVDLAFNAERQAWHYGWNSNKHTCRDDHVMRVYVFVTESAYRSAFTEKFGMTLPYDKHNSEDESPMYVLVQVAESPSFTIHCKKREKKTPKMRLLEAMKDDISLSQAACERLLSAASDKTRGSVKDPSTYSPAQADVAAYLAVYRERTKQKRRENRLALNAEVALARQKKAEEREQLREQKKVEVAAAKGGTPKATSRKRQPKSASKVEKSEGGKTASAPSKKSQVNSACITNDVQGASAPTPSKSKGLKSSKKTVEIEGTTQATPTQQNKLMVQLNSLSKTDQVKGKIQATPSKFKQQLKLVSKINVQVVPTPTPSTRKSLRQSLLKSGRKFEQVEGGATTSAPSTRKRLPKPANKTVSEGAPTPVPSTRKRQLKFESKTNVVEGTKATLSTRKRPLKPESQTAVRVEKLVHKSSKRKRQLKQEINMDVEDAPTPTPSKRMRQVEQQEEQKQEELQEQQVSADVELAQIEEPASTCPFLYTVRMARWLFQG